MSVKYIRGPGGRFKGSVPTVLPPIPSPHPVGEELAPDDISEVPVHGVVDVWTAFERSKQSSNTADPAALAEEALRDYRRKADEAITRDELYEAQDEYLETLANVPLGTLNSDVSRAWEEYVALESERLVPGSPTSPEKEPHGWLYAVAWESRDPVALSQVWQAAEEISRAADDLDPRLETAENVRAHLLDFNPATPLNVFMDAYRADRLNAMLEDPESDYVEHLVNAPGDNPELPQSLRDDIARRLGEWAERSDVCAQDVDDAANDRLDAAGGPYGEATIPIFVSGVSQPVLERFHNSPSFSIRLSIAQAKLSS